ncbi:MAG: glycosyltransferase family 2 protein [Bacteroidota bacterium]
MKQGVKITIITVVYNRMKDLKYTIDNVVNQTFNNYEYLIIDGGSSDGTLELIQSYGSKISAYLSEKDQGIYDAMNKGLIRANGEYLMYMNAGDGFYNNHILEEIFGQMHQQADFIYGDTMFIDQQQKEIGLMSEIRNRPLHEHIQWREMKYGMLFCHQSFIVKKEIAPLYDMHYKWSADIDWILKCMKVSRSSFYFTPFPIARFQLGGASLQHQRSSLIERFMIIKNHFGWIESMAAHLKILFKKS